MERKRVENSTTTDNQIKAYKELDKDTRKREIIQILLNAKENMTVREIAYQLFIDNKVKFFERNTVAPRITELCSEGILESKGTDIDDWTGKSVTVFGFTEEVKKQGYRCKYNL